jgi:hypothetical protein
MSKNDAIWVEGERELFLKMQRMTNSNLTAARKALRTGGMRIINDAKENLRINGSMAQGQLRKSGRVQAVAGDPDAIDAGLNSMPTGECFTQNFAAARRLVIFSAKQLPKVTIFEL